MTDETALERAARDGARAEQSIRLLAKLYEHRDAARVMLGARYAETMAIGAGMIKGVMDHHECDELTAALKLGKEVRDEPASVTITMAAVVEMLEPIP
jgi:hypothetical protein